MQPSLKTIWKKKIVQLIKSHTEQTFIVIMLATMQAGTMI